MSTMLMVMEYLDGESLSQRIQSRGRLSPHEAVTVMLQLPKVRLLAVISPPAVVKGYLAYD